MTDDEKTAETLLRETIDWSDEHRHARLPHVDACRECEDDWPCPHARAFAFLRRIENNNVRGDES